MKSPYYYTTFKPIKHYPAFDYTKFEGVLTGFREICWGGKKNGMTVKADDDHATQLNII